MDRGMSDEYSHWKLGGDGRWVRHHLDEDGDAAHRPAGRPHRDARQAAPQGPPPVTRPTAAGDGGDVRIPAAGTLPWRLRDGAPRGRARAPPPLRRLVLGQGQARPGRGLGGGRRARDRGGDRPRRAPRAAAARGALHRCSAATARPTTRWCATGRPGSPAATGTSLNEIDEVAWLDVRERARPPRLRPRPRPAARARAAAADRAARHLAARRSCGTPRPSPAATGAGDDPARPLDAVGPRTGGRAERAVLTAYGVTRVVTSPSERCLRTVEPYAVSARRAAAHPRAGCPRRASRPRPTRPTATSRGCSSAASRRCCAPTGRCCPPCSTTWRRASTSTPPGRSRSSRSSREARDEKLAKGEALVCHVVGTGEAARVVAVERHLP